jgi:hypothetical protein
MPTPGEYKTVQARILAYAEAIGWTMVSREEAEGHSCPLAEEGRGQECPRSGAHIQPALRRGRGRVARAAVALAVQPRG